MMMILTLVLCVLLFAERLTGEICHVIFGAVLILLSIVHGYRYRKSWKVQKRGVRITDWVMILSLVVLFLTGMLLHPMQGAIAVKIVHKLAAVSFAAGVLAHAWQKKRKRR
ncbi:MAG: hypothetical protein ACI4EG_14705 [Fusicatenibacter sp.]|nr:hypothetical protein [Fusicatenibacter sp.]